MNSDSVDPSSNKCLFQTSDGRTCRMLQVLWNVQIQGFVRLSPVK
jgi:hypothetical protein